MGYYFELCRNMWLKKKREQRKVPEEKRRKHQQCIRDSRRAIPEVTERLAASCPDRAILIRSIDSYLDPDLPSAFVRAGYRVFVSRQVYFFDGRNPAFLGRSAVKRDLKELRALKDHRIVEHEELQPADAPRIAELYRQLYIDKHSQLNPQYTAGFVSQALRNHWLEFG